MSGGGEQSTTNSVAIPQEFQDIIFGGNPLVRGSGTPQIPGLLFANQDQAIEGGSFGGILPSAIDLFQSESLAVPTFGETSQEALVAQRGFADNLSTNFLPNIQDIFSSFGEGTGNLADIATEGLQRQLQRNTLPTIGEGAIQAGQFGSSRQGIAEGLATAEANRDIADVRAQILQQGAKTQLGFAPLIAQLLGIPSSVLSNIGATEDAASREASESSFSNLLRLAQLVQGFIPGASQTQITEGGGPSKLQSAAGGAATGAAIGGPTGAAIGGIAGLLLA